ncbi:MAG TPA: tetratricopeptide repeat protein [Ignavibacteria bacterium]
MASLIPGYEYDIFISYRQKDNKHDGWVTEFVDNLKGELEATFKEEISVYFDINPHDGLLETHDVDASLKEKLKCPILIPIISQTYCDSKSFAWQNEFCAFNKLAKEDQLGRDIRLSGGNVASRILPVKIHELDPEDKTLLENELGGILRGIEFIYKSAGVNRPLRANEDHPQDNLNKTYYRDQINKVANAIKEIIAAIKKHNQNDGEVSKQVIIAKHDPKKSLKTKIIILSFLVLTLIALVYFFIPKLSKSLGQIDKSIAVLPFDNMSDNKEYAYFGDAMTDEIIMQLYKIKKFNVRSRISVLQYKNPEKTSPVIGKELNVNFLVEGSVQLFEDHFRIRVQLIRANTDLQIWSQTYEDNWKDILYVQSKIARQIADNLETVLTPEEIERIDKNPTTNFNAYSKLLSGNSIYNDAEYFVTMGKKFNDSSSFENAIKAYDRAIENDSAFALAYAKRAISRSWGYFAGSLDKSNIKKCKEDIDKALKIDPKLTEAQIACGFYYYYCKKDYNKAIEYFQKASDQEPGNWEPVFYMALVQRRLGNWEKSQHLLADVLKNNLNSALILTNIGISYEYLRMYDTALYYHDKAIKIMPTWKAPYGNKIETLLLKSGSTTEARIVLDTAIQKTDKSLQKTRITLDIYDGKYQEALQKLKGSKLSDFENRGEQFLFYAQIHSYLNNTKIAQTYYDSARIFFGHELVKDTENPRTISSIGIAYAGLKDKIKAMEAGERAVKLADNDVSEGNERKKDLAKIYVMLEEYDRSFKQIEDLLKNPSCTSAKLFQLDPIWKSLRDKPEFQRILASYSKN